MQLQMSSLNLVRTAFKISSYNPPHTITNSTKLILITLHFNIFIISPAFITVLYKCIEIMDNFHPPHLQGILTNDIFILTDRFFFSTVNFISMSMWMSCGFQRPLLTCKAALIINQLKIYSLCTFDNLLFIAG